MPAANDHVDGELIRLRERVTTAEKELVLLRWQINGLLKWKGETNKVLQEMLTKEEIAEAVAHKIRHDRSLKLSVMQKTAVGLAAAVAVASFVHTAVGWVR